MELTKEEAIRLHRELWGWLADNPDKEKADWHGWNKLVEQGKLTQPTIEYYSHCFACILSQFDCKYCLFIWPNEKKHGLYCQCEMLKNNDTYKGIYGKWQFMTKSLKAKAKLAAQIRDLPIREEVPNELDN